MKRQAEYWHTLQDSSVLEEGEIWGSVKRQAFGPQQRTVPEYFHAHSRLAPSTIISPVAHRRKGCVTDSSTLYLNGANGVLDGNVRDFKHSASARGAEPVVSIKCGSCRNEFDADDLDLCIHCEQLVCSYCSTRRDHTECLDCIT